MATRFKSVRGRSGAVSVSFDAVEVELLRGVFGELLALVADPPGEGSEDDELAAMVGIGTATTLPTDPVLARLFPDGYRDDDDAAADFRRYTEPALRQRKQENAQAVLDSLAGDPGKVVLDADQALAWLGALNDVRLAIGERVGISEDWGPDLAGRVDGLAEDDPRRYWLALYDLLTWLQETLVHALR